MKSTAVGKSRAVKGELITLYTTEDISDRTAACSTLLVLEDFNLSEEFARFHANLLENKVLVKAGEEMTRFTQYLIDKQYVMAPQATAICVGKQNRYSERFQSEYKYLNNPNAFVLDEVSELFKRKSVSVITTQGDYLLLARDLDESADKMAIEIWFDGDYQGMVELDIVGDLRIEGDFEQQDRERVKAAVKEIIWDSLVINVDIKSVFHQPNTVARSAHASTQ
ncbi:hypothetical protein ACLPJK_26420 [Pseudomonas aeruginosa]|uniref:hypothetical protein n=1 Tax=Pseudomonas aeruginosa TaxID=287 RepID=UPI003D2715F4